MATSSAFAAQFPEADFRYAIREAMKMGMPEDDAEKLTWFWKRARTYQPDDLGGRPLDWTAAPLTDDPGNPVDDAEDDGLIVDYALEANNLSSQVDQSMPRISTSPWGSIAPAIRLAGPSTGTTRTSEPT